MFIPQEIVDAVKQDNILNPRQVVEPVVKTKKIKNASVSGAHSNANQKVELSPKAKAQMQSLASFKNDRTNTQQKRVEEHKQKHTPVHKPKQVQRQKDNVPRAPATPVRWRNRNINHGEHKGGLLLWTYKRNYKVEVTDSPLKTFPYKVFEVSDQNKPKLVLDVPNSGKATIEETQKRCETIVRLLARGAELYLNAHEQSVATFNKEAAVFVPYQEAVVKITEKERISDADKERELAERLAKMNLG